MKKTNFNELLQRYLDGTASEEEKVRLNAWIESRKAEDTKDMQLTEEEEEVLFQKINTKIDNISEIKTMYAQPLAKQRWLTRRSLGIAASLLMLIIASFTLWKMMAITSTNLYSASSVETKKVILDDGTLVWLRGSSSISYQEDEQLGNRNAQLEGEALFEVAKDAQHPFILSHGKASIRVLGTSFNVVAKGDTLEVKVLTGRVQLRSDSDKDGVEVLPNEEAMYTMAHGIEKHVFNTNEVMAITSGTEYNMQFANASLQQIAERMEQKFNVKVKFENDDAGNCLITADFTDHSLESTLQLMTEVLDIRYTINHSQVVITGTCK